MSDSQRPDHTASYGRDKVNEAANIRDSDVVKKKTDAAALRQEMDHLVQQVDILTVDATDAELLRKRQQFRDKCIKTVGLKDGQIPNEDLQAMEDELLLLLDGNVETEGVDVHEFDAWSPECRDAFYTVYVHCRTEKYGDADVDYAKRVKSQFEELRRTCKQQYEAQRRNKRPRGGAQVGGEATQVDKGGDAMEVDDVYNGHKYDKKVVGRIMDLIKVVSGGRNFDECLGQQFAKGKMQRIVKQWQNRYAFWKRYRLAPPKGMLLTGPPGLGKTTLCKIFASELNAIFFDVDRDFMTKGVKNDHKLLDALIDIAIDKAEKENRFAILFMDECDNFISKTHTVGVGLLKVAWNKLDKLQYGVDGVPDGDSPPPAVLLCAATNFPDKLEKAVRDRLEPIEFKPLQPAEVRQIITENLSDAFTLSLSDAEWDTLLSDVEAKYGGSVRRVKEELCITVRGNVAHHHFDGNREAKVINFADFQKVLSETSAANPNPNPNPNSRLTRLHYVAYEMQLRFEPVAYVRAKDNVVFCSGKNRRTYMKLIDVLEELGDDAKRMLGCTEGNMTGNFLNNDQLRDNLNAALKEAFPDFLAAYEEAVCEYVTKDSGFLETSRVEVVHLPKPNKVHQGPPRNRFDAVQPGDYVYHLKCRTKDDEVTMFEIDKPLSWFQSCFTAATYEISDEHDKHHVDAWFEDVCDAALSAQWPDISVPNCGASDFATLFEDVKGQTKFSGGDYALFRGNAFDIVPTLPDNCVNLICLNVDEWFSARPMHALLPHLFRITSGHVLLLFNDVRALGSVASDVQRFSGLHYDFELFELVYFENFNPSLKYVLAMYDKSEAPAHNPSSGCPISDCPRFLGKIPSDDGDGGETTPRELYKRLIEMFSKHGDTVLDCFMEKPRCGATGTNCGYAATQLKRRFVGITYDEDVFESARSGLGDSPSVVEV